MKALGTSNMGLDTLNEDVLRCIYALVDQNTIFALCLTQSRLSQLAEECIYRTVDLQCEYHIMTGFARPCGSLPLFSEALARRPNLGLGVREISLTLGHGYHIRSWATKVIRLLPNLRQPCVNFFSRDRLQPRFLTTNALEK